MKAKTYDDWTTWMGWLPIGMGAIALASLVMMVWS